MSNTTEPTQAETQVSQADLAVLGRRLRDTLDTLREAVFQIDSDYNCQFFNSTWTEITGRCPSEALGQPVVPFFWSEDQPKASEFLRSVMQGDTNAQVVELRVGTQDGSFVWVELRARLIRNDTGDIIGLSGTILNITDRRHAELRLRQSEILFRTAFDLSPNGIAIYAVDSKFTQCNMAMCELFGYTSGQMMTMDVFTLIQPDDISQARKAIRRAQTGKPTRGVELRCMTREGRMIWVELAVSLLHANPGEAALVLLQLQDLSERKQVETDMQSQNQILFHAKGMLEAQKCELDQQAEQLHLARQIAEDASRAKTDFLANISHEIRTPMCTILGFSELLMDPAHSEEQRRDYYKTIRRSGEHLLGIIDDVLDISRIEAGQFVLSYSDLEIREIVSDVVSQVALPAREKNVEICVEYAGTIPAQIRCDALRLRQILMNLVSNSVKYTNVGHVKITVDMSRPNSQSGRRFLRLMVQDTGVGIANDRLNKLFKAFEQGDMTSARKHGGVGLGLAITKRLVDMLAGTIEVTSEEGRGTTFVVTLDVEMTQAKPADPARRRSESQLRTDEVPQLTGRVLLAEDGADNQRLISYLLRRCGLDVTATENGVIAVEQVLAAQADGKPFELILMDMQMPEMDGYQATQQLRASGVTVPVIALTAHAMSEDRDKCIDSGCTEYLCKPVDRRLLMKLLERFLRQEPSAIAKIDAVPADEQRFTSRLADDPAMTQILTQYIAEMPGIVARLYRSLASGDLKRLHATILDLKGSAGGYGFDEITLVASSVEASIRLGADHNYIEQSLNELTKMIRRIDGYQNALEEAA